MLNIPNKYTEEEIVDLLKNNTNEAIGYLYDHYSFALMGIIKRYVDDEQMAEDVLQEAFVKIYNNADKFDENKGRLYTWLLNITRNVTIDLVRSKGYKKQKQILSAEYSVLDLTDSTNLDRRFDTIGLRKRVAELKQDQRTIIDLAYFNGLTQDEIAKNMGLPLGTVKTKMRNAIISLRKLLSD
jgi:RNA polymerase sigma factor (sigma-70 family)